MKGSVKERRKKAAKEISMKDRFDLIVVGAGIVGLSCAYHLKLDYPDAEIVVLEKGDREATGDTSKSAGGLRNTFTSEVNFLLADSSLDFYSHVQKDLGFNLDLQMVGYLWLLSERQHEKLRDVERSMANRGIQFRVWSRDELQQMVPGSCLRFGKDDAGARALGLEDVSVGLQGLKGGTVGPRLVAEFYKKRLDEMRVKILFNTRVTSPILEPARSLGLPGEPLLWQDKRIMGVRTERGEMRAGTTLVAAGRWANGLLDQVGIDSHIKTKKRQIFEVGGPEVASLLKTKGFNESGLLPVTILPKAGIFVRPVREGAGKKAGFWIGAADNLGRPFAFEENPQPEMEYFTRSIRPVLSKYLPQFEGVEPGGMWAGEYDINTFDANPCIFEESGLMVMAGTSGSGIMKADAVGRIASALFDGRSHAELYGGRKIRVSRLGVRKREVDKEGFVL